MGFKWLESWALYATESRSIKTATTKNGSYLASYDFKDFVLTRIYTTADLLLAFESVVEYTKGMGDLYNWCKESFGTLGSDKFLDSIINRLEPAQLLGIYDDLVKISKRDWHTWRAEQGAKSLEYLESFFLNCVTETIHFWQMDIKMQME